FECKLDTAAFSTCSSGKSYPSLAEGSHTVQVRATDTAGNTGPAASVTWTVDTTAPTVFIDSAPPALTNSNAGAVGFHASETATFTCKLDNGAYAACASPQSFTSLADGSHSVTVRATDAAGNVGTSSVVTWSVD